MSSAECDQDGREMVLMCEDRRLLSNLLKRMSCKK